ncbi:MAG: YdcF family protein [Anaerostipes sp.]
MNKEISDAFNCIIEFLAVRDIAQMSKDALKQACGASVTDVIIALGSDLPVVAETACELYKAGYGEKLMFCGGIGHSTINLKKKVAKILNVDIDRLPESEAEIYACLAKDKYQIESSSIFMDKTSTNTSENIKNAIQIFNDHTIKHQNVILIQDPILQKEVM